MESQKLSDLQVGRLKSFFKLLYITNLCKAVFDWIIHSPTTLLGA